MPKTQVSKNGNDIKVEVEVEQSAQNGGVGTSSSTPAGQNGGTAANVGGSNTAGANTAGANQAGSNSAQGTQHQSYRQSGEAAGRAFRDAKKNATEVFDGIAPGHGNEIFFGLVGLVAAFLFFIIGFWQTLIIVVLVIAGVAFGQWIDGKPTILDGIKRLFSSNDN